ncbi:uncharacterized protein LOC115621440 [Scaptodrosophila lebanonensis]|uniref:Uncharacterized protein LOC115621440 n=1 Tax=Drosophila lebanonensis TaxID=7225 RepID=A0A6J2T759_DROLE|nr:uncharacterized protein LOC115621440 [Scaptodrosophila lebanonensis]
MLRVPPISISSLRPCGFLLILSSLIINDCNAHGRLIEPPSRASAWRYGFQTPPDYNDHELYCGGFTRQWKHNGGKCGECGDAWDLSEPRPHENGGQWGQGVIVRRYLPGSEMSIRVELTASHMGYFEFRLCPEPNAKQTCLDKNILHIITGFPSQPSPTDADFRFYPRNGSLIYTIKVRLPEITCNQCVLQWRYVAGNNWGTCDDGTGAVGCGPQEEFRACADIAISTEIHTNMRPVRPTYYTTATPSVHMNNTSIERTQNESFNFTILTGVIIVLTILILSIWYLYRCHLSNIKEWTNSFSSRFCKKTRKGNTLVTLTPPKVMPLCIPVSSLENTARNQTPHQPPPVPPPRCKRQSRINNMLVHESSIA